MVITLASAKCVHGYALTSRNSTHLY